MSRRTAERTPRRFEVRFVEPRGGVYRIEDIAEAVVFLASQAAHFITGQVLDVNGGMLMR